MAVKTVANNIGTGAVEWVWRKKLFTLRLDATKRINRVVALINR